MSAMIPVHQILNFLQENVTLQCAHVLNIFLPGGMFLRAPSFFGKCLDPRRVIIWCDVVTLRARK